MGLTERKKREKEGSYLKLGPQCSAEDLKTDKYQKYGYWFATCSKTNPAISMIEGLFPEIDFLKMIHELNYMHISFCRPIYMSILYHSGDQVDIPAILFLKCNFRCTIFLQTLYT